MSQLTNYYYTHIMSSCKAGQQLPTLAGYPTCHSYSLLRAGNSPTPKIGWRMYLVVAAGQGLRHLDQD